MIGKIYFVIILLISIFAFYYQSITDGFRLNLDLLDQIGILILLLGAFSFYFKKEVIKDIKYWRYLFYFLMGKLFLSFLITIWPSSYSGDFSFLNAGLMTNIFVVLLVFMFYFPLYFAVYKLAFPEVVAFKKPKKKSSKK